MAASRGTAEDAHGVYMIPTPDQVRKLRDSHGWDVCLARWRGPVGHHKLLELLRAGELRAQPTASAVLAEDDRIIGLVESVGGLALACREHGLKRQRVTDAYTRAGKTPPAGRPKVAAAAFVELFNAGATIDAAAKRLGVSTETVKARWESLGLDLTARRREKAAAVRQMLAAAEQARANALAAGEKPTAPTPEMIAAALDSGMRQIDLARAYRISPATLNSIVDRHNLPRRPARHA